MASGGTQVQFNTRERLVSTDHNRLQAKASQGMAEVLRYLLDAHNNLDTNGGGLEALGTGSEAFLRMTVLGGIRPRPEIGTTNLFIEAGVGLVVDNPTPGVDDSKASYVVDPGVQTAGVLTLTAGGGGGTRIDVIECQRVVTTLETDNRDIFNPSTGLFAPVQVNKVVASALAYRIRLGSAGAGFPGTVAGWCPLAITSVPSVATTWDGVELWDVRPLASDRVHAPFDSPGPHLGSPIWNPRAALRRASYHTDVITDPTKRPMYGLVEGEFGGYRVGGQLLGATAAVLDLTDTTLKQAGFAFANNAFFNLYLLFPFGLPRWVRYSAASSGSRVPRGLRGIPVLSATQAAWDGFPLLSTVASPSWTGLQDPGSQNAVLAIAGRADGSALPIGLTADGIRVYPINNTSASVFATGSPTAASCDFTFTDNVTHPAHARALYITLTLSVVNSSGSTISTWSAFPQDIEVTGPDGNTSAFIANAEYNSETHYDGFVDGRGVIVRGSIRVPLALNGTPNTNRTFTVRWLYGISSSLTISFASAKVVAWDVGP